MTQYLLFLLLFLLSGVESSVEPNFQSYSSCNSMCQCSRDEMKRVSVRCNFDGRNVKGEDLDLPPDVYSLDLSNNNLSYVPTSLIGKYRNITNLTLDGNSLCNLTSEGKLTDFPRLRYLSLRRNSIRDVDSKFFRGLSRLKYLNLSLNNIKSWTGNQSQGTHDLEYLDITGTIDWIPDEDILALPKLKELRGVTWCKFCANCTVVNPRNLVNESQRKRKAEKCLEEFDEMKFLEFGKDEPKLFIKHRYLPECMCVKQSDCEFRHVVMPYFLKRTLLPQTLFYLEYALSPFTILLNIVVIVTILSSRSLRKVPSFILIGHTAVIDFLIGIYSIWVAHVNITNINSVLEEVMWAGKELQPSTGPIFISGQLISVSISLLLTLERYLAVVYCVTPSKRMTAKSAHISLFFAWTMAITFAVMPIFGVGGLHYNIKRACAPLSYDEEFKSGSSLILLASLVLIVLLYLANLPLYVQLFKFVKKSSNQAGVKKELSLARKIAILVLTNFIFFAVPIILILVFSIFAKLDSNPFDFEGDAFQSTVFKISIGQWLPVTCLNINSLLDPFLYAFKHSHFKREIRRKIQRFSRKVFPSWAPSMNLNSVGDSVTHEPQTKKTSRIDEQRTVSNTKNKTAPVDNRELESQEKGKEFSKTI